MAALCLEVLDTNESLSHENQTHYFVIGLKSLLLSIHEFLSIPEIERSIFQSPSNDSL